MPYSDGYNTIFLESKKAQFMTVLSIGPFDHYPDVLEDKSNPDQKQAIDGATGIRAGANSIHQAISGFDTKS